MMKPSVNEGDVYKSKDGLLYAVENYTNYLKVEIRFLDTGWRALYPAQRVKSGNVVDKSRNTKSFEGYKKHKYKVVFSDGSVKHYPSLAAIAKDAHLTLDQVKNYKRGLNQNSSFICIVDLGED